MNWLTFILVYVFNIRSGENLCNIQKVFLFENDFWCGDQPKTNNGYLFRVDIDVVRKNGCTTGFYYFSKTCYTLKSTNLGYVVMKNTMMEDDITFFFKSPEVCKVLLKFRFLFTDKPVVNFHNFGNCYFKIEEYVTYKLPEKISGNSAKLRSDVIDIRLIRIKEIFEEFVKMKLLMFDEYIKILDNLSKIEDNLSKIDDGADFNLYYFEDFSKCLENLKKFIKEMSYFKLLNDEIDEFSIDKTTTLKVSQFRKLLYEKFNENVKKLNNNEIDSKQLFNECFDYFQNMIVNNKMLFPMGDNYDIDFYINQLSNLIYQSKKQIRKNHSNSENNHSNSEKNHFNSENNIFISYIIDHSFKIGLKKLQSRTVKDLCESEYIPKHFSKILEKEVQTVNDYINIENMVCDYHNMFVYVFNLYLKFDKEDSYILYSYLPPFFIDNYNLRIIDGIKIEFNRTDKFGKIRGFNTQGEEVIMLKDTDYFIDEFLKFYCPFEVLNMKNIQEIEVISFDEKKSKRFKINEYLNS